MISTSPGTIEHLIEIVASEIDSMIRDPTLREIICPDALRPIARPDHRLARASAFAGEPFTLHFKQARTQHLQRLGLVLVLRLLVLLNHH